MQPDELNFILSEAGAAVLEALAAEPLTPDTHLATAARLRTQLEPAQANAALELTLLRRQAAAKFSRSDRMYFTRDGLEQATAEPLAAHRAHRYAQAGVSLVADMGCGIGGDALALAATGSTVIAIDREWAHAVMTAANAAVYGLTDTVSPIQADLVELPPLRVDAFFFDPARRTIGGPSQALGRRLKSVHDYRPPLSLIDAWRPLVPRGAVKVSPAIDYTELPAGVEAEFVSFHGEVREGVLWYGELRTATRRATLLPKGDTLTDREPESAEAGEPRQYLYEPDGAVIRAHLVGQLAHQIDASLLDPTIAYLTADEVVLTPFARSYIIEDHFPFQLKRLRHYLRERDVGTVTIKKRGSPLDPDVLRQALRLRGDSQRTIFLTRVMGRATVLIGHPTG